MTDAELQPFDFRKNTALDDTAVSLRNWVAKSSSFFSDFWSEVSEYHAQLSSGPVSTHSYGALLETASREDYCFLAESDGIARSVWFSSIDDLRVICAEMLDLSEDESENADLTPVQLSLSQMFVEHMASALVDGWMGTQEISIQATELSKDPRKIRAFRSSDLVMKTSIQIEFQARQANIHLIFPKQSISELLESVVVRRDRGEPVSVSEQLAGQLPIEVVAVLGSAKIPMLELSELSVGKLIKLNQRIDRPITAHINDTNFYECWPGQIGAQQAVEVAKQLHG